MTTTAPVQDNLLTHRIHQALRQLCIGGNLRGFYYLAYAVELTVHDPLRVQFVTKNLYPDIARQYGVSPASVERAMRTALNASWERGGKDALNQMLGRRLMDRPSNAELVDMLADYIRRPK